MPYPQWLVYQKMSDREIFVDLLPAFFPVVCLCPAYV
jgi:hypothetical protein